MDGEEQALEGGWGFRMPGFAGYAHGGGAAAAADDDDEKLAEVKDFQ